jgi:class 3 adenylate cyclase
MCLNNLHLYRRQQLQEQHEQLEREQEKTENLLLNIMPPAIAQRLKQSTNSIADSFYSVSVVFVDIVGFTRISHSRDPQIIVNWLNNVFTRFDGVVQEHGMEKIKTIGDCYMLVGGVPEPRVDHAMAVVDVGFAMLEAMDSFNRAHGTQLQIRIGVNSGPVVAGVIGMHKFTYDLWGNTVNVASRMESTGEPGRIHISVNTANLVRNDFKLESRGSIEVKSLGQVETFFVNGRN